MMTSKAQLSAWAIRRPLSTLALTAVVLVMGLLFAGRLPVDLLPQVDYPHIRVVVNYPGVSPEIIEEQVTRPLERNLAATENLAEIHGRASEGRSYIEMYFDFGTDLDLALQDASRQLERARTELPDGIDPPRIMKMDPALDPVFELALTSPVRDVIELREWTDQRLMPQLLSVSGVGSVDLAGGREREIDIAVDPEIMRSHGLELTDLAAVVAARNQDQPIGQVTGPEYDVMGRVATRYRHATDVGQTLVPVGAELMPLSALAEVTDSYREQRLFAYLGEQEAVQVSIMKQPTANTVAVIEELQESLVELTESGFIPADIEYQVIRDHSFFIRAAVQSVLSAAGLGALLVLAVMALFLGSLGRALIVTAVIPVTLMATLTLMSWAGLTLNIMTLGAMALGVGLLIDNAIVMLENIVRQQQRTPSSTLAARQGAQAVQSAVIAGSATNVAAILPFLLLVGLAALIFREFILTIAFAVAASLLAALTLVPGLAARIKARPRHQWLVTSPRYREVLRGALQQRWWVLLAAALAVGLSVQALRGLPTEFFPAVDDGRITMRFTLPAGTSIEPTREAAAMLREAVAEMPHVAHQYQTVGGYFRGGQLSVRGGMIDMVVQLEAPGQRRGYEAQRWVNEFTEQVAALQLPFVQQRVRGPRIEGLQTSLVDADIAVGVSGENLAELNSQAQRLNSRLRDIPGISSAEVGRDEQVPQLLVEVDEQQARHFGLSSGELAAELQHGIDGQVVSQFVAGGFEYNIRLRYPRSVTGQLATLHELPVTTASGDSTPLGSMVSFREVLSPAHIERFNQIRVVWNNLTVDLQETTIGAAGEAVRAAASELDLPAGYSLIFAGEQETIAETQASLQLAILLAIFFVLVVLVVQYEKLLSPLVILASLPATLVGVTLGLWLSGLALSAPVLLGMVFLTGIVVNNAILLVEFTEQELAAGKGLTEALLNAGESRLRPVWMTTLTTVLGMTPLAFGWGQGSELLQPLAVTVIAGLLVSTLVTLVLVPILYSFLPARVQDEPDQESA